MPRKVPEDLLGIKQLMIRIHLNDKILFRKLLDDAQMNYQQFFDASLDAFLRGDPSIMKVIKDWKELNVVPKDWKDRYTLSHRERNKLLDEIEYLDSLESGTAGEHDQDEAFDEEAGDD